HPRQPRQQLECRWRISEEYQHQLENGVPHSMNHGRTLIKQGQEVVMDRYALQKLVEQARNDPKFLHALIFDTESVLKQVDYLDLAAKAALVRMTPEEAIAAITGARPTIDTGEYAP